ncbi:MAG: cation:proton antiporter [Candidatus Nanopelagicales bacterium]
MARSEAFDIGSAVIIAVIIAGFCRNRGWSSAIPLLLAGIAVGLAPFGPIGVSDPEVVLVAILAPLVFGEALTSSIVDLRRVSRPVMLLAVGLVVFGALVVGFIAQTVIPGIWVSMAFALGAILGPTDAVAVSATARRVGLPRRLVNILEGESLVNDGAALTLLRVFSLAAAAGSVTAAEGALILATSVIGGVLVGVIGGLLLMMVVRRPDTTVANGMILLAPLPLYLGAEAIEGSGILAVVVAALVVAHGTSSAVTYTGRLQSTSLWLTITFILQSAAFFLVGLEMPAVLSVMPAAQLRTLAIAVPAIFLALVAARIVFVYFMALAAGRISGQREWLLLAWAGTRGPVSALAAFTLPVTTSAGTVIPNRNLVISITFGVVLISLLLAPSVGMLARTLNLSRDDDTAVKRRVHVALARSALNRLEEIEDSSERTGEPIPAEVFDRLRGGAEQRLERAARLSERDTDSVHRSMASVREIAVEMMRAEQEELFRQRDREGLPDEILREMQQEIDVRIRALGE